MSGQESTYRLVVTSIIRQAANEQHRGFVRVIDFARREVLIKFATAESAFRASDPNPRGGLGGARGVATYGDYLLITNNDQIMVFDLSWKLVRKIDHPLLAGVHDILAEKDGIWATSASSDLLIRFD